MKYIVLKCCLIIVILPNVINGSCSFFEPLEYYDRTQTLQVWYAVRRYENGPESNTTCQILQLQYNTYRKLYFADGTSSIITGNNVPPEPGCSNGKITLSNLIPGHPTVIFITYTDYKNIKVARACYNNEGKFSHTMFIILIKSLYVDYLWIYSTKKRPCKKTLDAIDAIIKKQKLDIKPIFKM